MLIIGLTGGIGSGKTAVSNLFRELAVPIIDTDIITHHLLDDNPLVKEEIVNAFGEKVLDHNGNVERSKLAQIVFQNNDRKQELEKILHPKIRVEVDKQIEGYRRSNPKPDYLIVVIPLLLETGFVDYLNQTLVVLANEDIRIDRVQQRDGRNIEDIQFIIKAQVNDETRRQKADEVIENNNDIKELEHQVYLLHEKYSTPSQGDC